MPNNRIRKRIDINEIYFHDNVLLIIANESGNINSVKNFINYYLNVNIK